MNKPLRPRDDDTDRDKPRNKRRYDSKEKKPDMPDREIDRGVTRSRGKDENDWDEEDLASLDDDLDLDDEDGDEDWDDIDEEEDDWDGDPGFDDDDDDDR